MKYLLIILGAIATATSAPSKHGRIYGGQNATAGQFPFIVALNDPDQFCDGSIINKNWILTAAHCLTELTRATRVLVGTHIEYSGGTEYQIAKTIIHEDFDPDTLLNDIGLIQIDGELEYSDTTQPIELAEPEVNATCTAIGWGVTESVDYPEAVQYVELTVIDLDYCFSLAEKFLNETYFGPEQVCTLAPKGKGLCYGDSGGPLVCDGKLVGIVSYGVVPCAEGYPDIFTRTATYIDWIQNNINS